MNKLEKHNSTRTKACSCTFPNNLKSISPYKFYNTEKNIYMVESIHFVLMVVAHNGSVVLNCHTVCKLFKDIITACYLAKK